MIKVTVDSPKTPVTKNSIGASPATLPNVCKMPGPPAPFVPTPLPNVGWSRDRIKKTSRTVKIHKKRVGIKGTFFMAMPSPDVASQATGGGVISSKTQGKAKFVAPGSMTVKADGKNIHHLGDPMTGNG